MVTAEKTKKITKARKAPPVSLLARVYSAKGKETGSVKLPAGVFGVRWKPALVRQAATVMQANARVPLAHTKNRGEVRGGGRKPWRQKGTGRARHGSSRSPLWRGGGVTFGPRKEKVFARKLSKSMRVQALYSALSRKYQDGEVFFLDALPFAQPKAAEAKQVLGALAGIAGFEKIGVKKRNTLFIALPSRDEMVEKSFQNFGNVMVGETRNLNPVHTLGYTYLAIVSPEQSLATLASRGKAKSAKDANGDA